MMGMPSQTWAGVPEGTSVPRKSGVPVGGREVPVGRSVDEGTAEVGGAGGIPVGAGEPLLEQARGRSASSREKKRPRRGIG
jgi:hypothetical protein